jgi:hypothetical protein
MRNAALGAAVRLQMRWRRLVGHHPGGEAIGVGLGLGSLQVLERLFAGLPGLGRDRLQELVVGAVDLVHHMRAGQDAVERDAAAQRAFAHVDAFPKRPAASVKGSNAQREVPKNSPSLYIAIGIQVPVHLEMYPRYPQLLLYWLLGTSVLEKSPKSERASLSWL